MSAKLDRLRAALAPVHVIEREPAVGSMDGLFLARAASLGRRCA